MIDVAFELRVLYLRFVIQAETIIHLGPQAGAQIRGALWAALREFACTNFSLNPTEQAEHSQHCPMCRLMHLETLQSARGINPARPFAVRPPLTVHPEQDRLFDRGEIFEVTISLFGDADDLVGYVAKAMARMGQIGIGYHRGRFSLKAVQAINLLDESLQDLMQKPSILSRPQLIHDTASIQKFAQSLNPERIRLRFLTPTTLISDGKTLTRPTFPVLIARLLERCQSLEKYYTEHPESEAVWRDRFLELTTLAHQVRTIDNTRWIRLESGSRRTMERTSMSGFLGEMTATGSLLPFFNWLVWGSLLHVGKNAVKGNGWYEIVT